MNIKTDRTGRIYATYEQGLHAETLNAMREWKKVQGTKNKYITVNNKRIYLALVTLSDYEYKPGNVTVSHIHITAEMWDN